MAAQLSAAQCILLAVHFASETNIKALHAFTPRRPDVLDPELVLRILSTYLAESVDPELYTRYVGDVAQSCSFPPDAPSSSPDAPSSSPDAPSSSPDTPSSPPDAHAGVDVSTVAHLTQAQAQKRVRKLQIASLSTPAFPPHAPGDLDLLTRFICHRSCRIDSETGLLTLIPTLVVPFIDRSEYLRTWFISLVLPLLRLGYHYYPAHQGTMSLEAFAKMDGAQGVHMLLADAAHSTHPGARGDGGGDGRGEGESEANLARDLRGLVGPWMYGHTEHKRRRLDSSNRVSGQDETADGWEHVFRWMVHQAAHNFALVTNAVQEWDGPGDVDLGPYAGHVFYLDDETQARLERRYAQAAFAACYAVEASSPDTIDGAHSILVRLAELLDFEPPPDLATPVQQLPKIDQDAPLLHATESTVLLDLDVLLTPDHPLTTPGLQPFMLLQMLVYTAYQLASLGHSLSILHVAKLRFLGNQDDQLALLHKILHTLTTQGKRDEQQWLSDHHRLMWLWHWNIDDVSGGALKGAGLLGKIDRVTMEKELLTVLVTSASYSLIDQLYLSEASLPSRRISSEEIHQLILDQAMQLYDSASNGNRTRGSMKKAFDLIAYALRVFPDSDPFRRAWALLAATHSLSFYSLKLQRNVPFQPVNIRVSSDPLSLLPKVLEQNPKSYTNLDDMIGIGRNLVSAGLPLQTVQNEPTIESNHSELEKTTKLQTAERRVIAMCVEAALSEDDFETAYSYIANRLAPSDGGASALASATTGTAPQSEIPEDDVSWRAAFLGGRYRPRDGVPPTLRRLEQRTELLSLALLLAPPSNLSEILGVWRRCEEEASSLLAAETAAQESFDDRADRRNQVPGGFTDPSTEGMVFGQQRREVGRMTGSRRGGDEEAPMGLFELARGASRAFSRNAFPLRGSAAAAATTRNNESSAAAAAMDASTESLGARSSSSLGGHQRSDSAGSAEGGRVRRRDMLSNAVTGGLASGIGWVLGATPVDRNTSAGGGAGAGGDHHPV